MVLPTPPVSQLKSVRAKQLEALVEATLEAISDAVITVDSSGNIDSVNAEAERLLQRSSQELCGYPFAAMVEIFNEYDRAECDHQLAECFSASPIYDPSRQLLLRRADGSCVPIEDFAAPMRMSDGQAAGAVIVFKDVSERHSAQLALNLSSRMFHELLEFAPDAILIADPQGCILLTNKRAELMFGYGKDQFRQCGLQALMPCALLDDDIDNDATQERLCRRADGTEFTGDVSLSWLDTVQGARLMAMVRDATPRKQFEQQLAYQATHDSLTGLPNRAAFMQHLQNAMSQELGYDTCLALLYIDLDNFSHVNNTFGHVVGDELLKIIAERLQALGGRIDNIAFLGGDDFVLLEKSDTSRGILNQTADGVLKTIAEVCEIEGRQLYPGASIGIAVYPYDGLDAQELLRNADTARYRAKQNGRNNYVHFTRDMHHGQRERMEVSINLRKALQCNEFELHYQPKLDLHSMKVNSLEALIRWRHPERGLISPGMFIPIAEECGLIAELGAWVLEEACRQLVQWRRDGLPEMRIAVNLSAGQLCQDDIFARVMNTLSRYGLPSRCLEVEITESMVLHNPDQVLETFRALCAQGVQIAIDDFGTGYSSFSYLKQFPSQRLKIDKSFVDDLLEDSGNVEIVRAIIAVAHCLKMRVIAEGVETLEQLMILQEHGCDEIQGYCFGRPISGIEIVKQPWERRRLPEQIAWFDHKRWMDKIIFALQGDAGYMVNPETANNHQHCLFLNWYSASGHDDYGAFADYGEMGEIHAECHRCATEMIRLQQIGCRDRARDMIPKLFEMQRQLQKKLEAIRLATAE